MPDQSWSAIPEENAAIASLQQLLAAIAESLHAIPEAKYLHPAGAFSPER